MRQKCGTLSTPADRRFDFGPASSVVAASGPRPGEPRLGRATRRARAPADRRQPRAVPDPAADGRVRAPASPWRAARRSAAPPRSGQARPAARSACATSARPCRARVRERPGRRPAGRQASAERSCGARARTAPARAPLAGTVPQPITGANPTTSCSIEHANRAERAACPSRNRYRLTAYARVSRRSSPGVTQPRSRRARPMSAQPRRGRARAAAAPAPAGTRHDAASRREAEKCSSGTASARRARIARHGQRRRADARGAAGRTRHARAAAPSGARRPAP